MALPSVYRDGTATVAANGLAVTGQGTLWVNSIQPGDFFGTHKGSPNRIVAVNSNTSLTLAYPWLGGAQAASAYEIMLQNDTSRVLEAVRQLLEDLSGGNLGAFADLVGEADRIPVFDGPGAMSLLPAGAKGKQLLAASNLIAALAQLGPAGGYPPVPSAAGVGMVDGNFNTLIYPGAYTISGGYINGPTSAGSVVFAGYLEVRSRGGGAGIWQTFASSILTWERYSASTDGSVWTDWVVIDSATVGTVSRNATTLQPTGSILERGSNANGEYIRLADGTQMCWNINAGQSGATDIVTGGIFTGPTSTWTFPVAFSAAATTTGFASNTRSGARWGSVISLNAASMTSRVFSYQTSTSSLGYDAFAIGRWFNI